MSRAFMKEREDAPEPLIPTPERTHPNYVTARGLQQLHERLKVSADRREIEHLERSIESAEVLGPPKNRSRVAFGATVLIDGGAAFSGTFTIVGDDEADVGQGKIAFTSPLAEALNGARVGGTVVWRRPAGDLKVAVRKITYEE